MMNERVSGSRYVDRPRVERTTVLADTLRSLGQERATVFLAVVLYNASVELVAEKLGLEVGRVIRHFSIAVSALRHPSRSQRLRDYMWELDSLDPTILIDDQLRALIRDWRLQEMFEPLCRQCGRPMSVAWSAIGQPRTGRPRQYCSNACRQKAYRMRRR
jgi:ferredoxin